MTERRGGHFPCFDGLRAIAALAVVFHHAGFQSGATFRPGAGAFLARMDVGVTIFFLISGFLLYRPFVAAHLDGRPVLSLRRFWRRRALRIVPAYWVALTAVVVFFGLGLRGARDGLAYYGLVQIYDGRRFFMGGGPINQAWSLATEVSFYAFLPLYAWAVRRLGRGRVAAEWVGLGAITAVSLAFRAWLFPVHDPGFPAPAQFLGRYWLPAHLDLFALGMGMAVVSVLLERRGRPPVERGLWAAAFPWVSWGLAGLAFWWVSRRAGLPRGLEDAHPAGEWAKHGLYAAVAFFLLLPAVFGPQRRGAIRRFLASGPMTWLGLISYGIYLWHQAWLHQVRAWTGATLFDTPFWHLAGPALVLTLVVSALSYRLVERPALARKDPRPRRVPAPAPGVATPASPAAALVPGAGSAPGRSPQPEEPVPAGIPSAGPPEPGGAPAPHGRFPCFDGLRALAATSVLVHHVASTTGAVTSTAAGYAFAHFDAGVSVFFVLSGFLLYRPHALAHLRGHRPPPLAAFYRRRFLRIFPAYWVALTFFALVGAIQLGPPREAALYYGLVHIYSKAHVLGGIVPTWSLAVEVSFYAVLPLLGAAIGRAARGSLARELACIGALWATGLSVHGLLLLTHAEATPATLWLPAQIDLFALGMALAALHASGRVPAPLAALGRTPGLSWALAGVAFWVAATQLGLPRTFGDLPKGGEMGRQVLYGLTALFLVVPAAFGPQDRGLVRAALRHPAVVWVGTVSYGVFLWHFDWLRLLERWGALGWAPGLRFLSVLAMTVALALGSAAVSWALVEGPIQRRRQRRPTEPALAVA
jgi:peptidoglycan/LPS O-acetylase OafA/YrhL